MVNPKKEFHLDSNNISKVFSSKEPFHSLISTIRKKYPWRLFYYLIPKYFRKKIDKEANKRNKNHIAKCFNSFIDAYDKALLSFFDLKPQKDLVGKKIIWQYWGQGFEENALPIIVKKCCQSIDEFKQDYTIIRLDENNISEYINFPDFVWEKKKNEEYKHAFFADLIRLALLDVYGGIWMDATILLTGPIPDEIKNSNLFMYQRTKDATNQEFWNNFNQDYFCWDSDSKVNILNSFIVAKPKQANLHKCLDLLLNFWKTQNTIPHYFFFQIMFNELTLRDKFQLLPILDDTLPHLYQVYSSQGKDLKLATQNNHIHKMNRRSLRMD